MRIADCGLRIGRFWILDFGFWIEVNGFWILDFGFWIEIDSIGFLLVAKQRAGRTGGSLDLPERGTTVNELRIADCGLRIANCELQISIFRIPQSAIRNPQSFHTANEI